MGDQLRRDSSLTQPLLGDGANEAHPRDNGTLNASAAADDFRRGTTTTTFKKNLGAVEAFGIIISVVIGSGIFTSPGSIDTNVPSPGYALIVWVVGGILAWTGAVTFAELGTAIPGEGGVQPYLQHIYGDAVGFLAAWTWIIAIMPATLAIDAIVLVESAYSAAGITGDADRIEHKFLAVLILVVMSFANSRGTRASTNLNNVFVVIKFLAVFGVVLAGLSVVVLHLLHPRRDAGGVDWYSRPWFEHRTSLNPDGSKTHWDQLSQWEIFGHYSAALYAALWAYSGWDKAAYVSEELSNPERQLPLAINSALSSTIVSFLVATAAFYVLLPWDTIATTDSVAVTAIIALLGKAAGLVAATLICVVVAGALLGNSFVVSRMTVAAAKKGWLPSTFAVIGRVGKQHTTMDVEEHGEIASKPTSDAPINAVILSVILSTLYILFGNFRTLLTLNGLGEYSFFFLAVLGALILRYREPKLRRPYKTFIAFPIIFIIVSGLVVIRGAIFAPIPASVIVGTWAVGLAYYWIRRRWFSTPRT